MLTRNTFFLKEHVGVLKLTDAYDIIDPATRQQIGIAREEPPTWAKFLRLLVKKHMLPTAVNIYEGEGGPPRFSIQKPFTLFRSKVWVIDGSGERLGYFLSKLLSIGGAFQVFDTSDQKVADIKGDWKGWNFRMLNGDGDEIGSVTKKWAGIGKELFTSADNYVISIHESLADHQATKMLLIAAGLAIDIVYKEG